MIVIQVASSMGTRFTSCPKNMKGNGNLGNRAQCSSVVPPERPAPRGAISCTGGGENFLYTITSRHKQENFPDVVTSIIKVFVFLCLCIARPRSKFIFCKPLSWYEF